LDLVLGQVANTFTLTAERNDTAIVDIAITPNQLAVAPVVDALPSGNAVFDAVVTLQSADDARRALDQLSGETHASLQSTLIQHASNTGTVIMDRLAHGGAGTGVLSALDVDTTVPSQTPDAPLGVAVWGQTYGNLITLDGDGVTANQKAVSGGLLTGAETELYGDTTVGLLAGYGRIHKTVDAFNAYANVDSFTLAAYGERSLGPLQARFGTSYSLNATRTSRDVTIGALDETVTADYLSKTFQILGELGYQVGDDASWVEPFAGLSLVNIATDGFTEAGGTSALAVDAASQTLGVATLGARAGGEIAILENGTRVSYDASLGWRHVLGDVIPQKTASFASGSQNFVVSGTALDRDVAVIGAGVKFDFGNAMDLTLSYQGEFGQSTENHTIAARFAGRF
jgi:outer membrane autotransporter protein